MYSEHCHGPQQLQTKCNSLQVRVRLTIRSTGATNMALCYLSTRAREAKLIVGVPLLPTRGEKLLSICKICSKSTTNWFRYSKRLMIEYHLTIIKLNWDWIGTVEFSAIQPSQINFRRVCWNDDNITVIVSWQSTSFVWVRARCNVAVTVDKIWCLLTKHWKIAMIF